MKNPLNPDSFTDIPEGVVVVARMLTSASAGNLVAAKAFVIEVRSFSFTWSYFGSRNANSGNNWGRVSRF